MKRIYIDSECRCHTTNPDGTFREIETNTFDGKCDYFIEGYRFVLEGCKWVREDDVGFHGETISPWKDYNELDASQREYEKQLLTDVLNILEIANTK